MKYITGSGNEKSVLFVRGKTKRPHVDPSTMSFELQFVVHTQQGPTLVPVSKFKVNFSRCK